MAGLIVFSLKLINVSIKLHIIVYHHKSSLMLKTYTFRNARGWIGYS